MPKSNNPEHIVRAKLAACLLMMSRVFAGDAGDNPNGGGHNVWIACGIIAAAVGGYCAYSMWCHKPSNSETQALIAHSQNNP